MTCVAGQPKLGWWTWTPSSGTVTWSSATRSARWKRPWSAVRVGAGIDTPDPEVEPAEVEFPPLAVVIALLVIGKIVVAQHDARSAVFRVQRDDDTRGSGRDGVVVRPAPGEYQALRRVDLDELACRLDAAAHPDAVRAAGYRFQRGVAAHPLHVAARVSEVGEHGLGLGRDVQAHLDHAIIVHEPSVSRCSASASSLTRSRSRRQ